MDDPKVGVDLTRSSGDTVAGPGVCCIRLMWVIEAGPVDKDLKILCMC